jgi:hypothetical protein
MRFAPGLLAASSLLVLACNSQPDMTDPSGASSDPLRPKLTNITGSTTQPAQARALLPQAEVVPILSVGDILPGSGEPWAPTPDGLGAYADGSDLVVFANHELNKSGVTSSNGGPAFTYSRISRVRLDRSTLAVKSGDYVETGSTALERLCSATWVTAAEGFPDGYFFTGEEQSGTANDAIQVAVSSAGVLTKLPRLGRFSHENYIAVPGFGQKVVMIGTDDTSPSGQGALRSELYMYVADDAATLLAGGGELYVFKSSGAINSGYLQQGAPITGEFVKVEQGPQGLSFAALQTAVDQLGAFKFVRLEDADYDRRPNAGPAIYFVDTGNNNAICDGAPCDLYGSIYRMEFDASDPLHNARLVLLARSRGAESGFASPDNIAVSRNSLMLQEDPAYADFNRPEKIWNFKIRGDGSLGEGQAVVALNTLEQTGALCSDRAGTCWESSGIIDASEWLGSGTWLFDVQAHTLPFTVGTGASAKLYPKEGGQLLYLRLPGS